MILLHPRQSWAAWMLGERKWALKQWWRTRPGQPLGLTFKEWWSDRPWQ
jgi:hypothetical protein